LILSYFLKLIEEIYKFIIVQIVAWSDDTTCIERFFFATFFEIIISCFEKKIKIKFEKFSLHYEFIRIVKTYSAFETSFINRWFSCAIFLSIELKIISDNITKIRPVSVIIIFKKKIYSFLKLSTVARKLQFRFKIKTQPFSLRINNKFSFSTTWKENN